MGCKVNSELCFTSGHDPAMPSAEVPNTRRCCAWWGGGMGERKRNRAVECQNFPGFRRCKIPGAEARFLLRRYGTAGSRALIQSEREDSHAVWFFSNCDRALL